MQPCHNWEGCKSPTGYGKMKVGGKCVRAHRYYYCVSKSIGLEDIRGLHVLHECDNPSCINPDHLFLGTHQDNMADKKAKGRGVSHSGVEHGGSKFSEEDITAIRARYSYHSRTDGTVALAREFKVHPSTINRIVKGETYQSLN